MYTTILMIELVTWFSNWTAHGSWACGIWICNRL